MTQRPSVIRDLVAAHRETLPKWFRGKEPKGFALQEVFWSATAELVASEVLGQEPTARIRAGRNRSALDVSPATWDSLRQELGLSSPDARRRFADVLHNWLVRPQAQQEGGHHRLTEALPLALVLLTGVLERLGRNGKPLSFALEISELERVAFEDLSWVEVGEINAAALARQLLRCGFGQLGHDPRLLEVPYLAYWLRLSQRLGLQGPPTSQAPTLSLPDNFLLEGLHKTVEPPAPQPAPQPVLSQPRNEEIEQLYEQLDQMHRLSSSKLLPQILAPLLSISGNPIDVLDQAAAAAQGLPRDLTLACRSLLRQGEVELIGTPGDVVELSLPCRDYQLDDTTVSRGRNLSSGRFRIRQRGIRYLDTVVLPARVCPASWPGNPRR